MIGLIERHPAGRDAQAEADRQDKHQYHDPPG